MMPMPRVSIPKPKFIITKEFGGFTIKKLVKKIDDVSFLFFFKRKYEYYGYEYVYNNNTIVGRLGPLIENVLIFKSKKEVKKYIKENSKKQYFIY